MLLEIFWVWGTKTADETLNEEHERAFGAIRIETLGEDDFDAKVWLTLVRQKNSIESSQRAFAFMVTG